MNKDKSIDVVGHRKRAKDKFALSEGKGFADYELLELILFYSIPRIDVKPIAKALLRKFGSLSGVLYAPKNELQKFERVSDSTINLFRIITETNIRICKEKLCNRDLPVLANVDVITYHGFSVVVIMIPPQREVSFVGDSVFIRKCSSTIEVRTSREIIALNNRFLQ